MGRISREQMFMDMVKVVEGRSICSRAKVACLIVRDGRVLSIGYNGPLSGVDIYSPEGKLICGCSDEGSGYSNVEGCVHAEMNAIAWAAKEGIAVEGSSVYCSYSPCGSCYKLMVNAGIKEVVYLKEYRKGVNDGLCRAFDSEL